MIFMTEQQRFISPGRRQVLLGLVGFAVAGCAFGGSNNPVGTSTPQSTATSPTFTPGVTPTTGPAQGTTLYTYTNPNPPTQHNNWVNDLTWSPDSKFIASVHSGDNGPYLGYEIHVWDSTSGQQRFVNQAHTTQTTVAWSPDNKRIVLPIANDHGELPTILDAQTGQTLVTFVLRILQSNVFFQQITWAPDGSHVAIAGNMDVEIFDASTGQMTLRYPPTLPANGDQTSYVVAWSPDGNTIASAAAKDGHSIQFWDAHNGQPLHYFSGATPHALGWSYDVNFIAIRTSDHVQIQNVNTGTVELSIVVGLPTDPEVDFALTFHPHTITWSPDSKYLALATDNKEVQIWNIASRSLIYRYTGHSKAVITLGWSPDGSRIAS